MSERSFIGLDVERAKEALDYAALLRRDAGIKT
jgi:hypothetical protein